MNGTLQKQLSLQSMNIDENALVNSILQGKLDILKVYIKIKTNWPKSVFSVPNINFENSPIS